MTDNSDRDVLRTALSREAVIPARGWFSEADKLDALLAQDRRCAHCRDEIQHTFMARLDADHIVPVDLGGKTERSNLQLLCIPCHKIKTREDRKRIAKAARLRRDADPETRRRSARPLRGRGFQKADELK